MHLGGQAREVAPRLAGKPGAQLDTDDAKAPLEQRPRGRPGTAADLEEPLAGTQCGELHEVVEECLRIGRPGSGIEVRNTVEGLAQYLPVGHELSIAVPAKERAFRRRTWPREGTARAARPRARDAWARGVRAGDGLQRHVGCCRARR